MAAITNTVKQHIASCLGEEVSSYEALSVDALMKAAKGAVVKSINKLVMQLQL